MKRERNRATYDLRQIKTLAASGAMRINNRVRRFIANRHGRFDTDVFLRGLIESVSKEDFAKSEELEVIPGRWGDVYRGMRYEGEERYLKVCIMQDGTLFLNVLSANWDGYIH